jgi:hypothetical protein
MTLAKAKAKINETFIVQASLMIVTYDHKNMFIVQATGPPLKLIKTIQPFLNKVSLFIYYYKLDN